MTVAPYMFNPNADPAADLSAEPFTSVLAGSAPLTRAVKDETARRLWGLFGAQSSTYRCAGWAWPMHRAPGMRRILVAQGGRSWVEYWAHDKTALRRALSGTDKRARMVYA